MKRKRLLVGKGLLSASVALLCLVSSLVHASDLFVSDLTFRVLRYDGTTGAFIDVFASGGDYRGLVFGPDGNLYVTDSSAANVLRYDGATGAFIDVFASGGGLSFPEDLVFGPDGNLYVTSSSTDNVLRYDGTTGAFIDVFASGGGLNGPMDLGFGPDGNLYVSSWQTDDVFRYNGTTGAFMDVFASGGGLDCPRGLVFGPDGNLYVTSECTGNVLRYNGTTGEFMDVFASGGGLSFPGDLVFGSDGNLYVLDPGAVFRYNGTTGAFIDIFTSGGVPLTLLFLTFGPPTDCYAQLDANGLPELVWPLEGEQSDYEWYEWDYEWTWSSCGGEYLRHVGLDITSKSDPTIGKTIRAAYDGTVVARYKAGKGWGTGVTIEHIDNDGNEFTTNYTHIDPDKKIKKKVMVTKGQPIGTVANITKGSPHLHFSIRRAPYSNVANAGALPVVEQENCTCRYKSSHGRKYTRPVFPEYFIDPALAY